MNNGADIVIVGAGLVGSSLAYNLIHDGFKGRVLVIERDPSYQFASSALAMGGVRQQFMSLLNIQMVQYSIGIYQTFAECGFRQRGYLFLGNNSNWTTLQRRYHVERSFGAEVELLDVDAVGKMVPDLWLADVVGAVFGPKDGYVDARKALRMFRKKAEEAGAVFLSDEVVGIELATNQVEAIQATKAGRIETRQLVVAAGAHSGAVARMAGVELPVTPVRQQLFRCALPRAWPYEFPMVIDPGGVHWRSDGNNEIVIAKTKTDEPPGVRYGCDLERFYSDFLPDLVRRVPEFRDLKLVFGWGGLYEMTPDHNAIFGEHPEIRGLYFATGFSGHGLMMAPASGKVMSEFLRTGRFETVDVSPLSFDRFERGELFFDEALI